MHRRHLFMTIAAISLMASAALAEGVADQISRQLRDQGFAQITVTQTWLGRTRIVGNSKNGQREIIVNAQTGEILRDLFTGANDSDRSGPIIGNSGSDDNSDSSSDDNNDDDNSGNGGGDDNGSDDDDNSGSGDDDNGDDDNEDDGSGDDSDDDN